MKNITNTLSGLTSSLLLNVGLTRIAQNLDPVSQDRCEICAEAHGSAICDVCSFPEQLAN
jgi:hypothetical protein